MPSTQATHHHKLIWHSFFRVNIHFLFCVWRLNISKKNPSQLDVRDRIVLYLNHNIFHFLNSTRTQLYPAFSWFTTHYFWWQDYSLYVLTFIRNVGLFLANKKLNIKRTTDYIKTISDDITDRTDLNKCGMKNRIAQLGFSLEKVLHAENARQLASSVLHWNRTMKYPVSDSSFGQIHNSKTVHISKFQSESMQFSLYRTL